MFEREVQRNVVLVADSLAFLPKQLCREAWELMLQESVLEVPVVQSIISTLYCCSGYSVFHKLGEVSNRGELTLVGRFPTGAFAPRVGRMVCIRTFDATQRRPVDAFSASPTRRISQSPKPICASTAGKFRLQNFLFKQP